MTIIVIKSSAILWVYKIFLGIREIKCLKYEWKNVGEEIES